VSNAGTMPTFDLVSGKEERLVKKNTSFGSNQRLRGGFVLEGVVVGWLSNHIFSARETL